MLSITHRMIQRSMLRGRVKAIKIACLFCCILSLIAETFFSNHQSDRADRLSRLIFVPKTVCKGYQQPSME